MFPRAFEYVAPDTLDEALALLAEDPEDTRALAGGHSLLPLMKLRLASPRRLIDLRRLRGVLGDVRPAHDGEAGLAIGALNTYHALASNALVGEQHPVVCEVVSAIGDLQVRNRGTIGGSLAHADPAGDLPAVALALDVRFAATTRGGSEQAYNAPDFFRGAYTTALAPGELLTHVHLPPPLPRSGAAYAKFRNPASGYAVVGVAAFLALGEDGRVQAARVGVTGVGEIAYRAAACEAALVGQEPSPERLREAAAHAADVVEPLEDVYASGEYRSYLTGVYAERALARALERAKT
ncbi:MAG TPA: FAD binding domain-containing protein [Chloroflexota bacterium]|jgi:carbon-monoxide dehydrogenase medium subunit